MVARLRSTETRLEQTSCNSRRVGDPTVNDLCSQFGIRNSPLLPTPVDGKASVIDTESGSQSDAAVSAAQETTLRDDLAEMVESNRRRRWANGFRYGRAG